ncbi:non-ribosomal peptide synthetase [Solwaraspora sp. WMMD792]|uniref:non-ribosomal peptide synthetase n=1 Tax=Solwaraspora sp. WMMD792 TaxID=3016099 RepID=UPI002417AF3D|nr:non-ribosomal peptide synthetase [Solwaraspora sp. WMMD792]MDG4771972.1 amino acid adenylation domain-containing protein [Solwaraspora sp. WMMD792]
MSVAVPRTDIAATAGLSHHTGCPVECVLGAVAAIAVRTEQGTETTTVEATVITGGLTHQHRYRLTGAPSPRALLAQRGTRIAADDDAVPIVVEVHDDGDLLYATAGTSGPVPGWLGRLPVLMRGCATSPDAPIDSLSLLDDDERALIEDRWNDTARPYPSGTTASHLIAAQARRTPASVALICGDETLTYRQLDAAAHRLAARLRRTGAGPGDIVGVHLQRGMLQVVAMLAVWRAGAAWLPLDPAYPHRRLEFMLTDSGAMIVLTDAEAATPPAGLHAGRVLLPLHHDLLHSEPDREPDRDPAAGHECDAAPGGTAYLIYTSGSTGTPKGVDVPHSALLNLLYGAADLIGLGPADALLSVTSLSFDIATLELLAPLLTGGRVVIAGPDDVRDGARLGQLLRRSGAGVMQATPTTWQMLLAATPDLPPLIALCGGEPMPPALARRLVARSRAVWNMYGPTETTVWSTAARIGIQDADRPTIGRPLPNQSVYVTDAHLRPVPVGWVGELCIGGAGLARGYWNRPELTAERFPVDAAGRRLYRTGDLARRLPDGRLEILGRDDQQIKIAGFRVEPGEVEAALAGLSGVERAVVAAVAGPDGAKELAAWVVPADDTVTVADIRVRLARVLPPYLVPSRLTLSASLPLLPNGKIDRPALRRTPLTTASPAQAEPPVTASPAQGRPSTEAERSAAHLAARSDARPHGEALRTAMAAIWADVLAVDTVDVDDDFFGIGGSSLRAGELINRLQRMNPAGDVLYVRALFDAPTLRAFCTYLATQYPALATHLTGAPQTTASRRPDTAITGADLRRFRAIVTGVEPAPAAGPKLPRAAFILSAPRSGSTLLRVLLAGSSRLFAPPELELLGFDTMAQRAAALGGSHRYATEGLLRAAMDLDGGTAAQAAERLAELADRPVRDTYDYLQSSARGRLLVDKTSTYAVDAAAIRRAETLFDQPYYIHLVRHPGGMIDSFLRARMEQVFRHPHAFTPRELAELTWLTANDNVTAALADVPADRRILIRYEDLVADPQEVLTRLAGFLGVPLEPAMLDPAVGADGRMTSGLHPQSRMHGDPTFDPDRGVDATAAERWRHAFDPATLSPATTALARALGYRREDRPAESRTAPLSTHQRGIYLHEQISGVRTLYNICKAWRLAGDLDPAMLRAAVQRVVDRHEALRTAVTDVDGTPTQRVRTDVAASFTQRRLPATAGPDGLRAALEEFAAQTLDLETGLVLRAVLIGLGPGEWAFGLLVHHAMVDGSSLAAVLRDISAEYAGVLAARAPTPAPPAHFIDVLPDPAGPGPDPADVAYWRHTLDGAPALLPLPTERPRPARKAYRGRRVPVSFDGPEWQRVGEFARRHGATRFIVLLAVFKTLLLRYVNSADSPGIGVGTAFVQRPEDEDRGSQVVGMFTGNLPLYTRLAGDPTFADFLATVRETCLEAFEHHRMSFEDIVRELGVPRDPGYSPLVQVLFTSEPPEAQQLRLAGVQAERLDVQWRTAKYDLTVSLITADEALGGWWEYDADLWDEDQVQGMARHFVRLLRQVVRDAGRPLGDYQLLDDAQTAELLRAGAGPAQPRRPLPVEAAVRRHAQERPDSVAARDDDTTLTYADLDALSDRWAGQLIEQGIGAETIVAVLTGRTPMFVAACLAVIKTGAAYLPIDAGTPAERIRFMLRDSGAAAALVTTATADLVPDDVATLVIDGPQSPGGPEAPARKRDIEPADLAYVIYTSGSTGQPKGVLVEHAALDNFVAWFTEAYGLGPQDQCTQTVNAGFDACVMELWPCLAAGATLHFAPAAVLTDPAGMWNWLRDIAATVSFLVTPLVETMLAEPVPDGLALRTVITGGDRLHRQPALGGCGFTLINGYGPTENTILSTVAVVQPDDPYDRQPPIGRPVPGTTAYILDDRHRPVPPGVEGELYVGGVQVARGYLNQDELTRDRFLPDPFGPPGGRLYRTGDRVRQRADGQIDFVGRVDDQVKIRGFRIELGEIEAALRQIPAVADAAVVVTGTGTGRRLTAFVTGAVGSASTVGEHLRRTLPGYMVPSVTTVLDSLPLTHNGKVDRRRLRAQADDGPAHTVTEPATPLEAELLPLWRRVLGTEQIGVTDSFFEHGGHSLNAMRLASVIRRETGHHIRLPLLFQAPTVRDIARALTAEQDTRRHLIQLQAGDGRTPLICVHTSDGTVLPYAPLTGFCGPDQPVWGVQADPVPPGGHRSLTEMAAAYLDELRTAGVLGPVDLLGWSFGGLLAYEMARQSVAAGTPVRRVVLLDAEPLTGDVITDEEAMLREFTLQLRRRAGAVDTGEPPGSWPELVSAARRLGWIDAEVAEQELRATYDTFRAHVRLGQAYRPEPADLPLLLVTATDRAPDVRRAQVRAWQQLTGRDVEVVEIPGDHFDMVGDAALRRVAQLLNIEEEPAP